MNSNGFRYAACALTGLSLLAAVWLAGSGLWYEAAIMAGFVVGSVLLAASSDRLPALFALIFSLVAAINATGYVLELWESPFWFDEMVHIVTPFAIVSAITWLLIKRRRGELRARSLGYFFKVVLIGLGIGVLWEAFEWAIGIVGTTQDTIIDLAMDIIGASLAAIFCSAVASSNSTKLGR